jgi:outer membrane immunogenic protein
MFRKYLITILAFAFVLSFSPLAFADDVSTRDYNWTGPYVGLNAGWAKAKSESRTTSQFFPESNGNAYLWNVDQQTFATVGSPTLRSDNFVGGIQGGYNRQFGNFVFGGEIDFNYMNINTSETSPGQLAIGYVKFNNPAVTFRTSMSADWLLTLRPRIGYAFQNFLFYGTGGLALTDIKAHWDYYHDNLPSGIYYESASKSKTKVGWTIGGGIEVGLWKNWSIRGEYLYADFGSISASGIVEGLPGAALSQSYHHKIDFTTQTVRAGLNYRF